MSHALSIKHRELLAESMRAVQVWGSMAGQYDLEAVKSMGDLRLVVMAQCGFDPLRRAHLLDYQRRIGWTMDRQQVLNGEPWPDWLQPYHVEARMKSSHVVLASLSALQIEQEARMAMSMCTYMGEKHSTQLADSQGCWASVRRPIP